MVTQIKKEIKLKRPIIQIDDEVREMTDDEFANYKKIQDEVKNREAAKQADDAAKATAKQAILDRIGLTADELQTILG
jgi:hypothetical protein